MRKKKGKKKWYNNLRGIVSKRGSLCIHSAEFVLFKGVFTSFSRGVSKGTFSLKNFSNSNIFELAKIEKNSFVIKFATVLKTEILSFATSKFLLQILPWYTIFHQALNILYDRWILDHQNI